MPLKDLNATDFAVFYEERFGHEDAWGTIEGTKRMRPAVGEHC
jgi:hypothetical protein